MNANMYVLSSVRQSGDTNFFPSLNEVAGKDLGYRFTVRASHYPFVLNVTFLQQPKKCFKGCHVSLCDCEQCVFGG